MKERCYISGPITGRPNYKMWFGQMEKVLRLAGFKPVNPAKKEKRGATWSWYMKRDIKMLLKCDSICMLRDWESSKGARLERRIAEQLGLTIYTEKEIAESVA